jgi:hypothetical protein
MYRKIRYMHHRDSDLLHWEETSNNIKILSILQSHNTSISRDSMEQNRTCKSSYEYQNELASKGTGYPIFDLVMQETQPLC